MQSTKTTPVLRPADQASGRKFFQKRHRAAETANEDAKKQAAGKIGPHSPIQRKGAPP